MEDQKENAIQKTEPISPLANAAQLCQTNEGMDVEKLKELLVLEERWNATQAKKAFTVAMAAFKAEPPTINKDKKVSFGKTSYTHASLHNVTSTINSELSTHGLTASWLTSQENGGIKVTCKITHIMGHSEETSLTAPPDDSGSKNAIQQIGSTVTYLQRYTLLALVGLATYDQDDDGNGAGDKDKPKIPDPNATEQKFIDAVCEKLPQEDGKIVNRKKVGLCLYGKMCKYPTDLKDVDRAAEYVMEKSGAEGFYMEDSGENFAENYNLEPDENSEPQGDRFSDFDEHGNPI